MTVFSQQSTFFGIGNVDSGLADGNALTASTVSGAFCVIVDQSNNVEWTESISTAAKLATPLRFAMKKADGTYKFSPWFKTGDIIPGSGKYITYTAPTEQVSYVGANSAGTIGGLGTITAGNNYIVDVTLRHSQTDTNNTPLVKQFATQAVTGDTQQTVAKALFESANRVLNRGLALPMIKVDRIASGATNTQAAFTGSATWLKVTKGSTTVAAYIHDATSGLVASTITVADGDIISFPSQEVTSYTFTADACGTGAGRHVVTINDTIYNVADAGDAAANAVAIAAAINAGTVATATVATAAVTIIPKANTPSYVFVTQTDDDASWAALTVTLNSGETTSIKYVCNGAASSAATFQLDEPWQGETAYVIEGTSLTLTAGKYTIGTTPLWGLKLTGLALPYTSQTAITGKYQKVRFDVMPQSNTNVPINLYTGTAYSVMQGFDSTVYYGQYQAATEGSGSYEQVSEQESLSKWATAGNTQLQGYPNNPIQTSFESVAGTKYGIISFTTKNTLNGEVGIQPGTYTNFTIAIQKDLFDSGEDGYDMLTTLSNNGWTAA